MSQHRNITVHGQLITGRITRRYVVAAVRPVAVNTSEGTYVPYGRLLKQTDSLSVARRVKHDSDGGPGSSIVIVDTTTGEQVND